MSHTLDKPKLPGIQFLLNTPDGREKKAFPTGGEQSSNVNRPVMGHRSTRSVSSLPSDLQKLSLYPSSKDDSAVQPSSPLPFTSNKPPSWAQTATATTQQQHHPSSPAVLLPPLPTTSSLGQQHHRRNGHGRSVSEYTLPPQPPPSFPSTTTGIPAGVSALHHHHHPQPRPPMIPSFERHPATAAARTHRRAVSANTVDFMLRPPAPSTPSSSSSSSTSSTHNNTMMRAQSDSPPEQRLRSPPLQDVDDQHQLQRDASSGRYLCPYCNKGFSRPSSLRIHTYSHTGEKPYVCTEEGCGRRFSVQSNMRRHLRVHRMGRASMKPSPLRKP
ncbi:hypothetical protein LRAMOSA01878 [Lichtheimia ramosa]|uniref:C2H2-type domain-containing protein n=1 Tax=Lichtheimia ramosa TaxID=688394 RepID=A0A077WLD2_9FUNG|nr:hypothetical protein LRAMOSA01878 [Lichtheimia ramosa]